MKFVSNTSCELFKVNLVETERARPLRLERTEKWGKSGGEADPLLQSASPALSCTLLNPWINMNGWD